LQYKKHSILGLDCFFRFQKTIVDRIVWPYSYEKDSLYRWRAFILSSILLAALLFGFFALISGIILVVKENAWGLAFVNFLGLILGVIFLFVHRIKFEIRAAITLLMFYVIGLTVILSVGPLSGGPAWLFAFAVLSGVLIGNYAAFVAILMNAIFLSIIGIMISTGKFGNEFPFFNSTQAMIAAGINFIVLNAVTGVSVSALVKGLFHIYKKKEALANSLEVEQLQLFKTKQALELEIENRKQTEKALLKSETKYRRIYDNILDVYYEASLDGVILEISPSVEKHSQYKREELIGKSLYDIYANPADRDKLIEIMLKNGSVSEYELILTDKDGTQRTSSMNIELIRDGQNNPIKLVGIFRDITDRKKVDAIILESEEKFRTAFHTSPDAINLNSIVDGVYLDINDGFTKIMGYTREDVIGKSSVSINIWNNSNDRKILLEGLQQYGLVENLEANFIGKDGQIRTGLMSARVLGIANQDVILSITRDITEIKQVEKEKIKAQEIAGEQKKLALVGQIAGKMAHDFNNILGIIMGNAELTLMDCKEEETKRTLELIFEQTLRGKNLTKNLVAFAKDQEPKQEFFRISDKIDLVLNLLKKDLKGIELIKEDKPEVPDLLADAGMIEHALINLIQNSIHATSMSEHPKIIVKTYCFNNMICFKIEDNGCGIPKENLKNIYEPSFTLKGTKDISSSYESGIKGTGYGMANVKKYIEQHKGSISVNSEFGSGTKFTISLPVIKKELTSEEKIEIQKEKICFDKSILLVEDETAISGVQYRILSQEPCNHKVDIAHDGQVAMDLFKRKKYDLISLDYALPGKINGMDVYNHIRKTNKAIPILFISGNIEFLESIKELREKDDNIDHLSKPCQNKDYVNGINKLLERTVSAQKQFIVADFEKTISEFEPL